MSAEPAWHDNAAAKTGLHRGEVVFGAAGREIASYGDLQDIIRSNYAEDSIRLTVRRLDDGDEEVFIDRPWSESSGRHAWRILVSNRQGD